jgi:hypothetical protein
MKKDHTTTICTRTHTRSGACACACGACGACARGASADDKHRVNQRDVRQLLGLIAGCLDHHPTAAAETVRRLIDAGQEDALPVVLEVLESERDDRGERRVQRLRRASQLPPAKTFATFADDRLPRPLARQLQKLARGDFLDQAAVPPRPPLRPRRRPRPRARVPGPPRHGPRREPRRAS